MCNAFSNYAVLPTGSDLQTFCLKFCFAGYKKCRLLLYLLICMGYTCSLRGRLADTTVKSCICPVKEIFLLTDTIQSVRGNAIKDKRTCNVYNNISGKEIFYVYS